MNNFINFQPSFINAHNLSGTHFRIFGAKSGFHKKANYLKVPGRISSSEKAFKDKV
jgi:hypothetical protein